MTEDSQTAIASPRTSRAIRGLVLAAVMIFLLGAATLCWSLWRGPTEPQLVPDPQIPASPEPAQTAPLPPAPRPITLSEAEARMAALEARLAEAERRAATAKDNASRAERLLILTSIRHNLDRGLPLGFLEGLLQRQFGEVYGQDVMVVATGARQPVTLSQLVEEFKAIQPGLGLAPDHSGWADSVAAELRDLVVIRRSGTPSESPARRIARAEQALARDRVDLALGDVLALPGAPKARAWTDKARRYVAVRAALDRLEATTLLNPQPVLPR
ncbi:MAG: hypothetical protein ACKOXK_08520 [Chakrabartia sp.]